MPLIVIALSFIISMFMLSCAEAKVDIDKYPELLDPRCTVVIEKDEGALVIQDSIYEEVNPRRQARVVVESYNNKNEIEFDIKGFWENHETGQSFPDKDYYMVFNDDTQNAMRVVDFYDDDYEIDVPKGRSEHTMYMALVPRDQVIKPGLYEVQITLEVECD